MVKKYNEFIKIDISADGFRLGARDALDTARNINAIFIQRTGWFRRPKPIHIIDLQKLYKELCPDMDVYYPGVIEKIFHPTIIEKLGYPVDSEGMVHWK